MLDSEEYNIYTDFANVYDDFMDNIPYDMWYAYLQGLLVQYGINKGIVVDMGCGTGTMTQLFHQGGYDMIGIDLSYDMLEIAREKTSSDILYLQQDMREMELFGTVSAMFCVCDGMNYILEPNELKKVFQNVNNYLDPGGILIFDMKTSYFYEKILGNRTIGENRENASFLWENEYHSETGINEYLLTIYQQVDEERDLFSRCDEVHYQKAYEISQVISLIQEAGMEFLQVFHGFSKEEPKENSERVYFVAREKYQEGKLYHE